AIARNDTASSGAVPPLLRGDGSIRADDVCVKRSRRGGKFGIEKFIRRFVVHPGAGEEQRPEIFLSVLREDPVNVVANRKADSPEGCLNDLDAAIPRRRPRVLDERPGAELAIMPDDRAGGIEE